MTGRNEVIDTKLGASGRVLAWLISVPSGFLAGIQLTAWTEYVQKIDLYILIILSVCFVYLIRAILYRFFSYKTRYVVDMDKGTFEIDDDVIALDVIKDIQYKSRIEFVDLTRKINIVYALQLNIDRDGESVSGVLEFGSKRTRDDVYGMLNFPLSLDRGRGRP